MGRHPSSQPQNRGRDIDVEMRMRGLLAPEEEFSLQHLSGSHCTLLSGLDVITLRGNQFAKQLRKGRGFPG